MARARRRRATAGPDTAGGRLSPWTPSRSSSRCAPTSPWTTPPSTPSVPRCAPGTTTCGSGARTAGRCCASATESAAADLETALGLAQALGRRGAGAVPGRAAGGLGPGGRGLPGLARGALAGAAAYSRPRPWRSSIMPSAAPSGPSAARKRASTCCSRERFSRVPPLAARSAPISCEMARRRLHQLDDLGVAGVDLGAQFADPVDVGAGDGDGGGGGGEGAHRDVLRRAGGPQAPETKKRPGALRARGVCCGGCSASGDGHRIPVTVVKADRGEHGAESATAGRDGATTAPLGRVGRRWTAPGTCHPSGLQ